MKFGVERLYKKLSNNVSFANVGPAGVTRDVSLVFSKFLSDCIKFGTGIVYKNFSA